MIRLEATAGKATDTEERDEEDHEVKVTLDDGTETDVRLNKDFSIVGSEAETANESDNSEGTSNPVLDRQPSR